MSRSGGWTDGAPGRTRGAHLGDRRSHRVVVIPTAPAAWQRDRSAARRGRRDLRVDVTARIPGRPTVTGEARTRALYDAA